MAEFANKVSFIGIIGDEVRTHPFFPLFFPSPPAT